MANYDQVVRHGAFAEDRQVYSAAAISAGYGVLWTEVTGQPYAVMLPVAGAGGTANFAGVTVTSIAAGGYGTICTHGSVVALAHNTVTVGNFLQVCNDVGSLGEIQVQDAGKNQEGLVCAGHAQTGCADGEYFEMFVNKCPLTTSA